MLIKVESTEIRKTSLIEIIEKLDIYKEEMSFGEDIDKAMRSIHMHNLSEEDAYEVLMNWLSKWQPCLFGRMGAKKETNVNYDTCWINQNDIKQGDQYIREKIQVARRQWKDRALEGLSSGFLIVFQHERLARARPSKDLLYACQRAAELYVIEHAPLKRDTIYTEAIPLNGHNGIGLFKAGINIFYPGAHRTLNHDRRGPVGLLISVNSPGHLANSLVMRGVIPSLKEAVRWVYETAMRSVGNGGIGYNGASSNSWHNKAENKEAIAKRCPIAHRPSYIPDDYSGRTYSATYHTDVLLPTEVTVKNHLDPDFNKAQIWPWLVIDYISENRVPIDHVNYGLFQAHPILTEARYHNPWPPRIAHNAPLFKY